MNSEGVCKEIGGELQDMAGWLAGGELSPEEYRRWVTMMEERKLKNFGLKLNSSVSEDKMVHFTLRFVETDELCLSMDVDPFTGAMTVQPTCV